MDNQNIFDIQNKVRNLNVQNFANNYRQQNFVINPMIATFEQNRTLKDDKILYYAVATTDYKTTLNLNELHPTLKQICKTKEALCLIGVSRKRFYFQYYTDSGDLLYTNCFSRDMIQEIKTVYILGMTTIQVVVEKKNYVNFYLPDKLNESNNIPKFNGCDQTLVCQNIRNGIKNKDLII